MRLFILVLIALLVTGGSSPSRANDIAPTLVCSTEQPDGELFRSVLQRHYELMGTADLSSNGLSAHPDTVQLVTNDSTCAVVIAAHNTVLASIDSALIITDSALVASAGTSYIVEGPSALGEFVYDSTLSFKVILQALD